MTDDAQPTWDDTMSDATTRVPTGIPPALVPEGFRAGVLLGVGSQSRVYALEPVEAGPRLALKVVPSDSGTQQARFDREVRLMERVRHPHLARLRGVRHAETASGLIMDRIDGLPLQEWLESRSGTREEHLFIFRQVVGAVAAIHEAGAVHRDLKPGNILVRRDEKRHVQACLIDLGIAKSGFLDGITVQGATLGTPGFLSPEQIRDARSVDHRTDLFALGCLLHLLLAGEVPFKGPTSAAIIGAVVTGGRRPIREAAPETPEWLAELVDALLAKDPEDRPRDAAEVYRWLQDGSPPDDRAPTYLAWL